MSNKKIALDLRKHLHLLVQATIFTHVAPRLAQILQICQIQ